MRNVKPLMAIHTTPACIVCGKTSELSVAPADWNRYNNGELVQNVWPDKSPAWRELWISGTHDECWNEMYGEEEE